MVLELRQYTLKPQQRDVLIELFDREFVESQEVVGATIIGQFRDLDDADRFVWLRGFPDMETRLRALNAFYGGEVWRRHRDVANATMIDSDNVLLLRPAAPRSGFTFDAVVRDAPRSGATIVGVVYRFDVPPSETFVEEFARTTGPALQAAGASVLATFVTETAENNFPALPVREGENVFVFFARLPDETTFEAYAAALASASHSDAVVQRLRLSPPHVRCCTEHPTA
ncbi:MAG: NIPSNAP family protein [Candidatus Eremiobacteraeota bacterium]|nr:NIPSNAP family protein [Candidatus Eremiobacteraeota bacterium]